MTRSRLLTWIVLAALAGTACGPTLPLTAGLFNYGTDVFYGKAHTTSSPIPAPPNLNPLPNFPAALEAVPPPSGGGTPPPACPSLSATAVVAYPARTVPNAPPVAETYRYRMLGSEAIGGRTVSFPTEATRTIANPKTVTDPNGNVHFTYDVIQHWGSETSSLSFDVQPNGPANANVNGTTPAAGMYLTQMTQKSGDGPVETFNPQPAIQIMPYPLEQGEVYPTAYPTSTFGTNYDWTQGSGTDPLDGISMQLSNPPPSASGKQPPPGGQVMGKKLVNACGTALEAWEVDINGTIGDAHGGECPAGGTCGQAKSFDLLFDSATQYGGFFVADRLIEAGTDAGTGQSYYYAIGAEIEQAPVHPKQ